MNYSCPHCHQYCFVSAGMQGGNVRCPNCNRTFFAERSSESNNVASIVIPLHITIGFGEILTVEGGGKAKLERRGKPTTEYIPCNCRCGHDPRPDL